MSKAKILQPDLVLGDVVIHITPELLKRYNLKGLILDVDETLVPWNETDISPQLLTWIEQIRPHVAIWLVSNNFSYRRIQRIANYLGVPFLHGAAKPSRRKLLQAVKAMNLPLDQVAMVGDRLFTDILAGNRLGLFTILVEPMGGKQFSLRNFEVWLSQLLGVSLSKR